MKKLHFLDQLSDDWVHKQLDNPAAQALTEMIISEHPWSTFSTLTTADVASPERMKRIVEKTFQRPPLRGAEYFWVLEPFKERDGVHAHVLSKNEPPEHSWKETWKWYFEKRNFGRFQSLPLYGKHDKLFRVAAYLAKYCAKQVDMSKQDAEWGFSGTFGQRVTTINPLPALRSGSRLRSTPNKRLQDAWLYKAALKWNAQHRNTYAVRPSEGRPGKYTPEAWAALCAKYNENAAETV